MKENWDESDDSALAALQDPIWLLDGVSNGGPNFEETKSEKREINKGYLFLYVVTILLGFLQFGWQ
jgi:hypothetical protein